MERGQIGSMRKTEPDYVLPFEKHVAESKWQYCNCRSCQDKRYLIETSPPGTKFDFDKFRHKDERY